MELKEIKYIGGKGYIKDYKKGRILRDEKIYEIGEGK